VLVVVVEVVVVGAGGRVAVVDGVVVDGVVVDGVVVVEVRIVVAVDAGSSELSGADSAPFEHAATTRQKAIRREQPATPLVIRK
jgi:hypothetical protein